MLASPRLLFSTHHRWEFKADTVFFRQFTCLAEKVCAPFLVEIHRLLQIHGICHHEILDLNAFKSVLVTEFKQLQEFVGIGSHDRESEREPRETQAFLSSPCGKVLYITEYCLVSGTTPYSFQRFFLAPSKEILRSLRSVPQAATRQSLRLSAFRCW
jgi:hypothetical protein